MTPSISTLAALLRRRAPVFRAHPEQITFMSSPKQFFDAILSEIDKAQQRILLATLYFGNGELEREMVSKLKNKLQNLPTEQFRMHAHMDYLRGTRDGPLNSSASLFKPLVDSFPSHLTVSLYRTPSLGWRQHFVPSRWNEVFGLSHMKFFVFDNTVIMTGANLSSSYFTDRVDRYVCIKEHPELANYLQKLLKLVEMFSYKMNSNSLEKEMSFDASTRSSYDTDDFLKELELLFDVKNTFCDDEPPTDDATFMIPTIQMAPHHVRQDEKSLEDLVSWFNENLPSATCTLASGYFNLSPLAQHIFSKAQNIRSPWRILTSSPRANSFFGSSGASRYIPDAYRSIEHAFLIDQNKRPSLARNAAGEEVIYEYNRPNWTFHAKGLWMDDPNSGIAVTIIGSSNFGHRSFEKDLEAQLTIITSNADLAAKMRHEREALFEYCILVSAKDIEQEGMPSKTVQRATAMIKSFL